MLVLVLVLVLLLLLLRVPLAGVAGAAVPRRFRQAVQQNTASDRPLCVALQVLQKKGTEMQTTLKGLSS